MVGSSHTLLVVSALDIRIVPVGTMGPFLLEDNSLKTVKGLVNFV